MEKHLFDDLTLHISTHVNTYTYIYRASIEPFYKVKMKKNKFFFDRFCLLFKSASLISFLRKLKLSISLMKIDLWSHVWFENWF